jgi:hypothetical protein
VYYFTFTGSGSSAELRPMKMKLAFAVAALLLAAPSLAEADWVGNWSVNYNLHQRWWMKPVDRFFAVNGPPQKHWDNNGGIVGIGSHYRWVRGACRVLIRVSPQGRMESLNSYGPCAGVVR